jgi:hypothetical protein
VQIETKKLRVLSLWCVCSWKDDSEFSRLSESHSLAIYKNFEISGKNWPLALECPFWVKNLASNLTQKKGGKVRKRLMQKKMLA